VIAASTSTASSLGTNTPSSLAIRGTDERPPPTSTPNPSSPSWIAPTSAMQLISGALSRSGVAAIEYLCLRGRFEKSGLP
jgi:hypothetical protein